MSKLSALVHSGIQIIHIIILALPMKVCHGRHFTHGPIKYKHEQTVHGNIVMLYAINKGGCGASLAPRVIELARTD